MITDAKGGLATALLSTILAVSSAQAADGDPQRGRVLAEGCVGCHAVPSYSNVYPNYHVPKVGGQHAAYIVSALRAYRDGLREHPTMNANASALNDQDMADVAAFFASVGK